MESEGVSVLYACIFTYPCGKYLFRSYQPPRTVMKQPRRLTKSIFKLVILRQLTIEIKSGRIPRKVRLLLRGFGTSARKGACRVDQRWRFFLQFILFSFLFF